jgi:hypothetical protein
MTCFCKNCGSANPSDAIYCHWDGAFLQGSRVFGPANLAQAPFPEAFYFPTGEVCQNFDQFALVVQQRWSETWELLKCSGLEAFLSRLGRADLITAAREASAHADPDLGVASFLSRLPTCSLMPPRLNVTPRQTQLGKLRPGKDVAFSLRLNNDGHGLIVGSVTSDCPWLQVESAIPGQPHAAKFVQDRTLRVLVLGSRLTAGAQPRLGKVAISTNAGDVEAEVSCEVPIIPFPEGMFAGCQSPREVALKAKQSLHEAGELFFSGTVQKWYRANGWVYPVEGEPASGRAAVQQFFEALGLTKPPQVVLDTPLLAFQGPAGARIQQVVELHTEENRPIFAFGRSSSAWLSIAGQSAHGSRAFVVVEATVPATTAVRLETQLNLRCNGNQRFRVPVVLAVASPSVPVHEIGQAKPNSGGVSAGWSPPSPDVHADEKPRARSRMLSVMVAAGLFVLVGLCVGSAALLLLMRSEGARDHCLKPYAAAISKKTCIGAEINLTELAKAPGLGDEARRLQKSLSQMLRDLDLRADDLRLSKIFVALAPDGHLTVWKFESKVRFGNVAPGHYEETQEKGLRLFVDRLDPQVAWAVDGQGRLVRGPPNAVRAALDRENKGATNEAAYAHLAGAAPPLSAGAIAWAVGDFAIVGVSGQTALLGEGLALLQHFNLALKTEAGKGLLLHGEGKFSSVHPAFVWVE